VVFATSTRRANEGVQYKAAGNIVVEPHICCADSRAAGSVAASSNVRLAGIYSSIRILFKPT
jgi:hypothetical protein